MYIDILLLDFLGFPSCWWWWLLCSLGAFLLGWLLNWLFFTRGLKDQLALAISERDGYHAKFTNMEKDYMSLKYQHEQLQKERDSLKLALRNCESDKAVLNTKLQAKADSGGSVDPGIVVGGGLKGDAPKSRGGKIDYLALLGKDNLQIIEGVGPKISKLLTAGGFSTWAAVAGAKYDDLKKVLDDAGPKYRIHDPKSWPKQAELANTGQWTELINYQKFLDTGRENKGDFDTPSKVEKLIAKLMGYSNNPEDLKIIEGVGPKIEQLMKDAGIKTWADVAASSIERLQEILEKAGDRYRLADPTTWPKQADLAASGKWDDLKEYQDYLSGGKSPK
ncbi:MAG: hypothetical protein DHS20C18_16560 [Saprospiraceae bacterium]|nr:MAG: hypothetical protein DHS20C18_16560 [Saprospiraceae bacterium]